MPWLRLEAGYKGNYNHENSPSSYAGGPDENGLLPLDELYNRFKYDTDISALYVNFSGSYEHLTFSAGLRGEMWQIRTRSLGYGQTDADVALFKKNDFALFPSASIGWSFLGNNELKLNYSRRIRRPFGPQLNTFENISDPSEVHLGNPLILPEYSNAVELSYIKNWTGHMLSVSGYLRTNNDMISHVSFLAPMASDPNVNTMYYGHANVGNMVNSGVEIISRNLLFRRLTLTTTLNLYNSHLKAWSADYPLHDSFYAVHGDKQNRFVWDVRCMASVRLPWNMTFQAQAVIIRAVSPRRGRWNPIGMSKPGYAKISVLGVYRFSARIFSTQKRRTMSFMGTATRSQSANGREVAHYVWPSPIPSENPTVVSIIATTTSTPVATEKSIIIKLVPPTGRG